MKLIQTLLAAALVAGSFGASAQVSGSQGGGSGNFLQLSSPGACSPCTLGPGVATISGGTSYNSDSFFADKDAFASAGVFGGNYLATGPDATQSSMLTFTTAVSYVSFLWGSPDYYNQLTVSTTAGIESFTAASLGLPGDGSQSFSRYVEFWADAGVGITGLTFGNTPAINAFEAANFSITPVPEPETYALMLAGLGALGFMRRRRRAA